MQWLAINLSFIIVMHAPPAAAEHANTASESVIYSFGGGAPDGSLPYASLLPASDGNFYGTTYSGGAHNAGTVFRLTPGGTLTTLYSFGNGTGDGQYPLAGLVQGNDGSFYGTTQGGGAHGEGTVFKVSIGGTLTTLYSFGTSAADGANPIASLTLANDGNFYGTTRAGGTYGYGTVFKITVGGTLATLYSFGGTSDDGRTPAGGLVQYSDGSFYGTTSAGGANGKGTLFKISLAQTLTTLYSFGTDDNDGATPQSELVLGSDGNFYGTTEYGGKYGDGTIFYIAPSGIASDGTGYSDVYDFQGVQSSDGANPRGGLVLGSDGNFYGTTQIGGANDAGSVFVLTSAFTEAPIYSFSASAAEGANPQVTLARGSNGNFYGTTLNGGPADTGTVFTITPDGTLATLHTFGDVRPTNGSIPAGELVQGSDGSFYGVTSGGGGNSLGTIFSLTPSGTLNTLYSFAQTDGANPAAGLLQANDGSFYAALLNGGAYGSGTVFRFTSGGTSANLHDFGASSTDGLNPAAALIEASDGNFYGTTSGGGANGKGTVFRLTPDGSLTTLYSFGSGSDGSLPLAGLVPGPNNKFYGTTSSGGTANKGTLFAITGAGTLTTLHNFGDGTSSDGATPEAGLILGSDGNLYGITRAGGINDKGTVFRITTDGTNGTLTTLYSFGSTAGDGTNPDGRLAQGRDGNYYGTTNGGGANDKGTVFQITPDGALTTLYSFGSAAYDASNPLGGLLLAQDGSFYGTASSGGRNGTGAVFKVTVQSSTDGGSDSSGGGGGATSLSLLLLMGGAVLIRQRAGGRP
jgi:uncharacterized repeat protein (TIGR03803 family)